MDYYTVFLQSWNFPKGFGFESTSSQEILVFVQTFSAVRFIQQDICRNFLLINGFPYFGRKLQKLDIHFMIYLLYIIYLTLCYSYRFSTLKRLPHCIHINFCGLSYWLLQAIRTTRTRVNHLIYIFKLSSERLTTRVDSKHSLFGRLSATGYVKNALSML